MTRQFIPTADQEAWLQDLETTDAPQTTGVLCRLDSTGREIGRCCLGRAYAVFGVLGEVQYRLDYARMCFEGLATLGLGNGMCEQLQLLDLEGKHRSGDPVRRLSYLNDETRKSFREIAEIIRSDPWGYFERDSIGPEDARADHAH